MDALTIALILLGFAGIVGLGFVLTRRRPASIAEEIAAARSAPAPGLASRLGKSRAALGGSLRRAFARGALDDELWDSLEEALIGVDVGVSAASTIVSRVRAGEPSSAADARRLLRDEVIAILAGKERALRLEGKPAIIMVVGVNGTGKTTSIAKVAARLVGDGKTVLLGAADTFRAAADVQLRTWAERVGVDVVSGQEGADPAAVAFDALAAARARGKDVVIVDTAGRLQSKKHLMAELGKMVRVLEREGDEVAEVLLVLDATAGQNGVSQARQFFETAGVTGIVLSKLDGTARGGIVIAIESELGIPVKLIGVGEGMDDLVPFEPTDFVDALLADA